MVLSILRDSDAIALPAEQPIPTERDPQSTTTGPAAGELVFVPRDAADVQQVRPVPHEFGPAAVAERLWLRAAALRPGALVAVSSADGGVGRSTLVATLGGLLALAVPGPVLAVDMNPVPWGGLAERVGRANAGTIWDAVRDLQLLTSASELQRWVQHGPTGMLALLGETEIRGRRPPSHDEASVVVETARHLVSLTICDVQASPITAVWHTLSGAHTPLLVARASVDSLQHTLRLAAHLRVAGYGPLIDRCVLAVVATAPRTAREVRAVVAQAGTVFAAVVDVPFDPQLALPEPVDVRRLRKITRRALVRLADAVLERCVDARYALPADTSAGRA